MSSYRTVRIAARLFAIIIFLVAIIIGGCQPIPEPASQNASDDSISFLQDLPAPSASAQCDNLLSGHHSFSELDSKISHSLDSRGYEYRYFILPSGFAIVTRVERIESDGTSSQQSERWNLAIPSWAHNASGFMRQAFIAPEGYWRLFVFVLTDSPFKTPRKTFSRQEALDWLQMGYNTLPAETGERPVSSHTHCTVMVYEFAGKGYAGLVDPVVPGKMGIYDHLRGSGLLRKLLDY